MSPNEPLMNPIFLIPSAILVIADILFLPYWMRAIKREQRSRIHWMLVIKPILMLGSFYFLLTQFGGAFYVGSWYGALAPIIALAETGIFIIFHLTSYKNIPVPTRFPVVNGVIGLLLGVSVAVPSFLWIPAKQACAQANIPNALLIADVLERYKVENGVYPKFIGALTPEYMEKIPDSSCGLITGFDNPFKYVNCDENPYLITHSIDGMGYEYYSMTARTHTSLWSFLDGSPNGCEYQE
jgi:hypothetical protein